MLRPPKLGTSGFAPNHGQFPEAKPFVPMRIFLSYGHDANEEQVRCVKANLEILTL